jgi:glycosyltransferase involved in cell wall biosynthesis
MKILHLGFEDHRRPGSGGGSLRNHEVNRRLAARGHDVEVVTARFRGARPRREDGVLYRPVGVGLEYFTSLLSYQALLPGVVLAALRRSRRPDLLVEEFAPPWSTLGVNRWTSIPTVGSVQGYFAVEKASQYHLPRALLESTQRWGTRGHSHLIAGSAELAGRLRSDAPRADVSIIPLGVAHDEIDSALKPSPTRVARRIVYLGRLESAQKGLDLLIEACDGLLVEEDAELIIAGDGRDEQTLRTQAARSTAATRIHFCGRVSGREKWRLLAGCQLSVLPSRYETFGLSALESLACGTPVAAFDIESLRDTVGRRTGTLVPPFDVDALREAIRGLLRSPEACTSMGEQGRRHASRFSWENVARAQEDVYMSVAGR